MVRSTLTHVSSVSHAADAPFRRLAALVLGLSVALPPVALGQDELLHYEPPAVDQVYPVPEGVTLPPCANCDPAPEPPAPSVAPQLAPPPPARSTEPEFGARAQIMRTVPGVIKLEPQASRDVPGTFGDPLRIIDALPGIIPIASGVPYVYMRGAPPAAQGYVYDGIPLPQLFHGAFGPAVVHPRMTGPLELYAGVAPANYGRRTGGFVLLDGVEPQHSLQGELDVRLFDINGFVDAKVGRGDVTAAGRIGYPRLSIAASEALGILEPGTRFTYWDGQLRYRVPLSRRDRAEIVWLGSFDAVDLPDLPENQQARTGATQLEFHRIETRLRHTLANGHVNGALRFGYDDSRVGDTLHVRAVTIGPRLWGEFYLPRGHRLDVGADLYTSSGSVDDQPRSPQDAFATPDNELLVSLPHIAEAAARIQGGIYSSVNLLTSQRTRLTAGARLDYWGVESRTDLAVDPRVRFEYQVLDPLRLHAAVGTGHQPAVFLLPLPALSDIAVSRKLSSSIQTEIGADAELPSAFHLGVNGFYHHYEGLLLPELIADADLGEHPPLSSADVYGTELLLKRAANQALSGWLSYTLSFAQADSGPELIGRFKPDFDVRHVVNAVFNARIWHGWVLGGRLQARSGRLIEQLNPRYQQRLPWFVRADGLIGYQWPGRFCDMFAYIEWLNLTVAREYLDADCFFGQCIAQSAPPIALPNLGVRGTFR